MIVPNLLLVLTGFFILTALVAGMRGNSRKLGIMVTLAGVSLTAALVTGFLAAGFEWWQVVALLVAALCFICSYQVRRENETERLARFFPIGEYYPPPNSGWELIVPDSLIHLFAKDRAVKVMCSKELKARLGTTAVDVYGSAPCVILGTSRGGKEEAEKMAKKVRPVLWRTARKYKLV